MEAQSHLDAMEVFEVYNKKHKQELLDRIKELETEVEKLKKQTPQELVKEVEELKKQLEQANQQLAQVETPPKESKSIKFFKFGGVIITNVKRTDLTYLVVVFCWKRGYKYQLYKLNKMIQSELKSVKL